jgi:glycosyltransferase involved in cell wall biosynthesis
VGPSLDILGGQAVQLDRLRSRLETLPGLSISFIPVNPRLPGPLRLLQRIRYVRTLATSTAYVVSLLRRLPGVDVVHAFSASYWSFLLAPVPAMLIGRLFGKKVIINYHSGEADDHLANWRSAVPLLRLADRIVVPSGYLVEVFAHHHLAAEAIGNFVEIEHLPFRERPTIRPRFLSNRNLEQLYNVACTLRAFATIQREIPDARLTVAGDGSQRGALEALAHELGLRQVQFTGRIAPSDMAALYADADVYLNSPDIDNMPVSVIEAFAAGLTVVTTDAGGIPYLVRHGETGLMVSRNDAAALAREALRLFREEGLAARLAGRARQDCLAHYVWPAVSEEWRAAYRALARSRAATTAAATRAA